jgi:hypothetical protein
VHGQARVKTAIESTGTKPSFLASEAEAMFDRKLTSGR